MSSAGKSSKSATRFSVTDLTTVKSGKKKAAASPSTAIPKPTASKGKKRKASEADNLEGLPLIRHQFLEYFADKFAEIEDYVGSVEEVEQKCVDLQKMMLAKDKKIASLENDVNLVKRELVLAHITADQEKNEITNDAKISAAIAMYKTQLQMAQEALDPDFDKSSWDVEGWKARLAELDDEEEVLAIEAGGSGVKDQVDDAGAGGDGDAAKV